MSVGDVVLTPEEILLCEQRFDNGYDIYTNRTYVAWLWDNHRDAIPSHVLAELTRRPSNAVTPGRSSKIVSTDGSICSSSHDQLLDTQNSSTGEGTHTRLSGSFVSPSPTRSADSRSSAPGLSPASGKKPPSVISEFLKYPNSTSTPKSSRHKATHPRVLTSTEAIAMMKEKERKKEEELAAKEQRKKEREERKVAKEEEKKRKAIEREQKQKERKKKAQEKEEEKKRKAAIRAMKRAEKENTEPRARRTSHASTIGESSGLQHAEINNNECAVCIGSFDDDIIDGKLQREWIQCTNTALCGKWMHCDCSVNSDGLYVCKVCKSCFN